MEYLETNPMRLVIDHIYELKKSRVTLINSIKTVQTTIDNMVDNISTKERLLKIRDELDSNLRTLNFKIKQAVSDVPTKYRIYYFFNQLFKK